MSARRSMGGNRRERRAATSLSRRPPPSRTHGYRSGGGKPRSADPASREPSTTGLTIECEVLPGLMPLARDEVSRRLGRAASPPETRDESALAFHCQRDAGPLLDLRTIVAAYLVLRFPIPRPLALLGDQHLRALVAGIATARELHPPGAFRTLHVGAAGSDSPVLTRLRHALSDATGLADDPAAGDLELRLRRAEPSIDPLPDAGWEVLVRLSPRPLSVRPWRLHNLPGAVNATVAAAIAELGDPRPSDRYLNLLCGSGTLLVERLLRAPARAAVGVDLDPLALSHAGDHLRAAGLGDRAQFIEMDATALPPSIGEFDSLAADLPWGQLTGSHRENAQLYPRVLAEAHRVAAPGARLILLTHEVALLERILPDFAERWRLQLTIRILQGGLHPRIYLLRRAD